MDTNNRVTFFFLNRNEFEEMFPILQLSHVLSHWTSPQQQTTLPGNAEQRYLSNQSIRRSDTAGRRVQVTAGWRVISVRGCCSWGREWCFTGWSSIVSTLLGTTRVSLKEGNGNVVMKTDMNLKSTEELIKVYFQVFFNKFRILVPWCTIDFWEWAR